MKKLSIPNISQEEVGIAIYSTGTAGIKIVLSVDWVAVMGRSHGDPIPGQSGLGLSGKWNITSLGSKKP